MDETFDTPPVWFPDPRLRQRLGTAISAALIACSLSAAGAVATLVSGPQQGFTLTHACEWAALVPALWVFEAFAALGRDAGSPGLERSARCLYVAGVLIQLHGLTELNVLAPAGTFVVWIIFVVGLVALLALPFVKLGRPTDPLPAVTPAEAAPEPEDAATVQPEPTEVAAPKEPVADVPATLTSAPDSTRGAKTGLAGALAVGLLIAIKALAKTKLFAKIFAIRALRGLKWDWAAFAFGLVVLIGGTSFVWFAVSKIRLRHRLGWLMAMLGWLELIGAAVVIAIAAMFIAQLAEAADAPGLAPQVLADLEHTMECQMTALGLAADICWTALTVCVLANLRARLDPEVDVYGWETQS